MENLYLETQIQKPPQPIYYPYNANAVPGQFANAVAVPGQLQAEEED